MKKETKVKKEILGIRELKESKGQRVQKGIREILGTPVRRDPRDHKALPEPKAREA